MQEAICLKILKIRTKIDFKKHLTQAPTYQIFLITKN